MGNNNGFGGGSGGGGSGSPGEVPAQSGSGGGGAPPIDGVPVAGQPPTEMPPDPDAVTTQGYEAEEAFNAGTANVLTGASAVLHGFSGTGYAEAFGAMDAKVVFAVNIASDGTSNVRLSYNNAGTAKQVAVQVNGALVQQWTLETSAGFAEATLALPLRRGLNTIALVDTAGDSGVLELDRLDVENGAPRPTRGAIVPFTEYEAEAGSTNGVLIGPDRTFGTVAAEASGRRAVVLETEGQYVEWTTTEPADAIVLRYSIADAPAGEGTTGTLSLYVDGVQRDALALSSKYAWVYGDYPFNNDPTQGTPHRYFDETRYLVGEVPVGSTLRLQVDAGDTPVTVDLIDTELVPAPYPRPQGSLSIEDYGATADDGTDDTAAIQSAIAAASDQGAVLWVPQGNFEMIDRLNVDNVTIRGAGPWHSVLHGLNGKGGFRGVGDSVVLLDFALFGDVSYRDDEAFDAGLDGSIGVRSLVQNIWFEHTKVGIWIGATDGAYIVGCRFHDTFADGMNLTGGTRNSAAEHVHVRNTGDDAFAMWANGEGNDGNRYKFNTAVLPMLANGFAIYGGSDNRIEDSVVRDTVVASAGITLSTRHSPTPFGGTTRVARNTLTRTGGHEVVYAADVGALWIFADTSAISAPIVVQDMNVSDSTYPGILLMGVLSISGVVFDRITVSGAGSYGIEALAPGSGSFNEVVVSDAALGGANLSPEFLVERVAGNVGW
jgi:hypothetical protein